MILLNERTSGVNFLTEFELCTFATCYVLKRVSGNSHVRAAGQHSSFIQQVTILGNGMLLQEPEISCFLPLGYRQLDMELLACDSSSSGKSVH